MQNDAVSAVGTPKARLQTIWRRADRKISDLSCAEHDHGAFGDGGALRAGWAGLKPRHYRRETLFYDGEPFLTSVEKVREKIVWLVSAWGNFERPQGLPCAVDFATGMRELELLEAMRGFDRYHNGFF
jgi:hypothetical protein